MGFGLRLGKNALHWGRCVLRDAPRLCRVAPQHEGMLFTGIKKMPHPEAPRDARPRRTHDILPTSRHSCPALASPAAAAVMAVACLAAEIAVAQKPGGVLQVAHRDSPASMSTLEEVTISTVAPMMAVFNNLVIFDQHVPQNTLQSIVPDLATG